LGDTITASAQPRRARKVFLARQAMGRLATAEEIAETFVYLASDESSFMTGQALYVDGGMRLSTSGLTARAPAVTTRRKNMRLLRYGPPGREKPGLADA